MATYEFIERPDSFTVRAEPHPCDVPGEEAWFVDFCNEHTGGRRTPVTIIRRPTYFEIEGVDEKFPLFQYRELVKQTASILMSKWKVSCINWINSEHQLIYEPYSEDRVEGSDSYPSFAEWYEQEFAEKIGLLNTPEAEHRMRA